MTRREAQELLVEMLRARESAHKYAQAQSLVQAHPSVDGLWNQLGDLALAEHKRASDLMLRVISAMCGE